MNQDQVRKYWEERASSHPDGQKTTMDVNLREIEYRSLRKQIILNRPNSVLDVGCGDGKTTIRLAHEFPAIEFFGIDFSKNMISTASSSSVEIGNIKFSVGDILNIDQDRSYDLVFTNRCLINLTSWNLQASAINNIMLVLNNGGTVVLIENLVDSQEKFNTYRRAIGLPQIPIREHNLFFQRTELRDELHSLFKDVQISNISSTYYFLTRIIYSKLCELFLRTPNYDGFTHKKASLLPSFGNIGPINLIVAHL